MQPSERSHATAAAGGGAIAHLVREYFVEEVDDALHSATFDGRRLVLAAANRLVRLVPESGRAVDQLETFPARGGLAYDGKHLWQRSEGVLQQLNPRTGDVLRSVSPEIDDVVGLECIGSDLLVLHGAGRALTRIETLDATAVTAFEASAPLRGLAWVARELWSSSAGELCRIDPVSGRVVERVALPAGIEVSDLAGDDQGRVWCVDGRSRFVRAFVTSRAA